MIVRRRFPNCFSGFEETEHDVNSYEELIALDWIKDFMDPTNHDKFVKLAYAYDKIPHLLMLILEETFWVVGYIYGNPEELGLQDIDNGTSK